MLDRVCGAMDSGEDRPGQHQMTAAVADAITEKRHLVVQAGTGTGKSLAYLIPALESRRRVVIATATKALQDQLADRELPLLASHFERPVSWAVLKGRSNYLCRQRLDELTAVTSQLSIDGIDSGSKRIGDRELRAIAEWADDTRSGDRADLAVEPAPHVWSAVSVGPRECPGASKCPRGDDCFAEAARRRAADADVVIVNTHLYGLHLASNRAVLPDHQVVVFDEAHEVEDIISATTGIEVGSTALTNAARVVGGIIAEDSMRDHLDDDAERLRAVLRPLAGSRLRRGLPPEVSQVLLAGRGHLMEASAAARAIDSARSSDVATRTARLANVIAALVGDIDQLVAPPSDAVMWVGGTEEHPRLELAPLDVGLTLDQLLWNPEQSGLVIGGPAAPGTGEDTDDEPALPDTVVFTSATIPAGLASRLRMPEGQVDELDVGTPFDFVAQSMLYCAAHMPDPRSDKFGEAVVEELERLIVAAGGRTLALFTSHRAMNEAADELARRLDPKAGIRLYRQGDLPKPALVDAFRDDEASCLFATMGFWAGIDVPGRALSLVTIDKIPFPRPDEPLMQARRERAGRGGVRHHRSAPGGDDAGPGRRPADPLEQRPGCRRRARSPARQDRQLPLAARLGAAAHAALEGLRRGRRVPRHDHRSRRRLNGDRRSVAEPVERLGAPLPVLVDLDEQLEERSLGHLLARTRYRPP